MGASDLGHKLYVKLKDAGREWNDLCAQGWRQNVSNRLAYGVSSCEWGGQGHRHLPETALGVSDFLDQGADDWDQFVVPLGDTLEDRPRDPLTLSDWAERAKLQTIIFCLICGQEYMETRKIHDHHLQRI